MRFHLGKKVKDSIIEHSLSMYYSNSQIYLKITFKYICFRVKKKKQDFFLNLSLCYFFLQIKVLTDIGFFTEAFHELCLLNCGERIPWKIPAGYKINEEIKVNTSKI